MLLHSEQAITALCGQSSTLCEAQIREIQDQWAAVKFDYARCDFFGLHEKGDRGLRSLERTARASRQDEARRIAALIRRHKDLWMDGLIGGRDALLHPPAGSAQAMFQLVIEEGPDGLRCTEIRAARVANQAVDAYVSGVSQHLQQFITAYLPLLRPT